MSKAEEVGGNTQPIPLYNFMYHFIDVQNRVLRNLSTSRRKNEETLYSTSHAAQFISCINIGQRHRGRTITVVIPWTTLF